MEFASPDDSYKNGQPTPENLPRSYAANHTGWGEMHNDNRVITVTDVRGDDGPEWDMTSPAFAPPSKKLLYTHKPRHLFFERPMGMLICLFNDGHMKALSPMLTMTPTNFWTRDNAPFAGPGLQNAQSILRRAEEQ